MMLGDDDWTVRVLSALTGNPLKVFQIGQDTVIEGIKNEEFYIEVEVPIKHHSKFLLRDNATQFNATVQIDGTCIGVSWILTASTPKHVFTYSLVSGNKCALVFVEPEAIPYENEAEAKRNIEKNKVSPVGTIVVEVWTSTSGGIGSGSSATIAAKPAVAETKKFYEMPSLGLGKGRVLKAGRNTHKVNRINKIGTKTIKVQTSLMIDLLVRLQLQKEIELRNQQNPPQASIAAAAAAASVSVSVPPPSKKQRKDDKDEAVDAPKVHIFIDLT